MSSTEVTKLPEIVVDKYSVNDLLDNVNYSFPGYIPSVEAFDFVNFMQLVLGEAPENKNYYPKLLKEHCKKNAPPILYGVGNKDILNAAENIAFAIPNEPLTNTPIKGFHEDVNFPILLEEPYVDTDHI